MLFQHSAAAIAHAGAVLALFRSWFDEAHPKKITSNPNDFAVACLDTSSTHTARIVLCKNIPTPGGRFRCLSHAGRRSKESRRLTTQGRFLKVPLAAGAIPNKVPLY